MLVSTSGLAGNSTIAGGSSRNPKSWWQNKTIDQRTITQTVAVLMQKVDLQTQRANTRFKR